MDDFSLTTSIPDSAPTARELAICGGMTIHHAAEIKTALVEALNSADDIRLNLEEVTEIDLVGLQLICASHRTATVAQKLFSVNGKAAVINAAADAGGFTRHIGCIGDVNHNCVWLGGAK